MIKLKKLTKKQMRMVLGIMMMYAFLVFAHMLFVAIQMSIIVGALTAFSFIGLWFYPPLAVIVLTYFMLMKIYPAEEKNES